MIGLHQFVQSTCKGKCDCHFIQRKDSERKVEGALRE